MVTLRDLEFLRKLGSSSPSGTLGFREFGGLGFREFNLGVGEFRD